MLHTFVVTRKKFGSRVALLPLSLFRGGSAGKILFNSEYFTVSELEDRYPTSAALIKTFLKQGERDNKTDTKRSVKIAAR